VVKALPLLIVLAAGCDVEVLFTCSSDQECGPGGTCITATGGCAFPASECGSGLRYDPSAGDRGGMCTDAVANDLGTADLNGLDLTPPPDMARPLVWTSYSLGADLGSDTVANVWGADSGHAWAIGNSGLTWYSTDRGESWAKGRIDINLGAPPDLRGIWGTGLNDIFVVANQGYIWHSGNAGSSWDRLREPPVGSSLPNLFTVWGTQHNNVYAGVDVNPLLHYNGSTWNAESLPIDGTGCTGDFCNAIWGSGADDVYAVGDGRMHWDGANWKNLLLPQTPGVLSGVWGTSRMNVYIVGSNTTTNTGALWHTTDGGATWSVVTAPFGAASLRAVTGSGPYDVYVGANDGKIYHSGDGGLNWTSVSTSAPVITAMWAIDQGNVLASGQNQILWGK
jgi:photosystem II stability/assembly factor-like uncharacterized protein